MYRKNTAGQFICVQLLLTATGAPATGLAPAARRCLDGTFAAGTGTYTEDGTTGSYKYAMSQADTNANDVSIITTATGAIPVCVNVVTTAADPTNAATFGITDIDATISSRMATYTQPTGFLAATFPSGTVANQTNITGGTITTVTNLTNAATSGDLTATMKASAATAIWTDTTAGDFTTALSVGKSVMNGVSLGTGLTVNILTNLPSIPANWLTAAGINAAALNGKGDWNTTTPPTAAAIATGVWTDTTAGDFTAALSIGKSVMNGVSLGTGLTINAYTGNTVQTGDGYARLGAPAGASTAADIAAVKTDTAGIKTQTDKLAFTVANQVDSNALSINGNATAAANVSKANQALVRGTVGSASTTTSVICSAITSPSSLGASGQLIGRTIIFDANTTTANLQSQATNITASTTGATPTFTVTALTTAPVSGDTFTVV